MPSHCRCRALTKCWPWWLTVSSLSWPSPQRDRSLDGRVCKCPMSDVSMSSTVFSSAIQPLLMEKMSRWVAHAARKIQCPACFPVVCLDAACSKINSRLWSLTAWPVPNTALTANSKIQGPTVYRSMSQPLPSISVLYTSSSHCNECSFISWNMHSASVKVAALAVSIDSNCQLLSVKHPNEERMLMNIVGPNPPSDPHAPHKFGQGGLQQITILTVAFQYCWITSARHGNASWLS